MKRRRGDRVVATLATTSSSPPHPLHPPTPRACTPCYQYRRDFHSRSRPPSASPSLVPRRGPLCFFATPSTLSPPSSFPPFRFLSPRKKKNPEKTERTNKQKNTHTRNTKPDICFREGDKSPFRERLNDPYPLGHALANRPRSRMTFTQAIISG